MGAGTSGQSSQPLHQQLSITAACCLVAFSASDQTQSNVILWKWMIFKEQGCLQPVMPVGASAHTLLQNAM
jgi:hypothetical protein